MNNNKFSKTSSLDNTFYTIIVTFTIIGQINSISFITSVSDYILYMYMKTENFMLIIYIFIHNTQ